MLNIKFSFLTYGGCGFVLGFGFQCFCFKYKTNLIVQVFCFYVCLYTTCMSDAFGGQKKVSDFLEPELQMA